MLIPPDLIDLTRVADINLGGKGGKGDHIALLLPKWKTVGAALYDFETTKDGIRYRLEVKKQQNMQWFDIGKYYHMSEENQNIRVMFLNHYKGKITNIIVILLGDLIGYLYKNYQKEGWTEEVMSTAAEYKKTYPSLQFKVCAPIKTIFDKTPESFEIIYPNKVYAPQKSSIIRKLLSKLAKTET
jgi:hypothetical protein